jgi:hypothetical protein
MDEHGRRKTVFAGTFAIARKSVSNSRPITLVERDALKRIRKGYTRAMYLLLSQCLRQTARANTRATPGAPPAPFNHRGVGWGLFSESLPRTTGAEKTELATPAGETPSRFPSRTLRPDFFC